MRICTPERKNTEVGCLWGWRGDRGEDYGIMTDRTGIKPDRRERAKNGHYGLPTCNPAPLFVFG